MAFISFKLKNRKKFTSSLIDSKDKEYILDKITSYLSDDEFSKILTGKYANAYRNLKKKFKTISTNELELLEVLDVYVKILDKLKLIYEKEIKWKDNKNNKVDRNIYIKKNEVFISKTRERSILSQLTVICGSSLRLEENRRNEIEYLNFKTSKKDSLLENSQGIEGWFSDLYDEKFCLSKKEQEIKYKISINKFKEKKRELISSLRLKKIAKNKYYFELKTFILDKLLDLENIRGRYPNQLIEI